MKKDKKIITNKRRSFIKKAGLLTLGAAGATAIKAPYAYSASNPIKWRLQTYSGAPLGAHVIKPQIEAFNKAAPSRYGLCIESTDLYSNLPGADTLKPQVLF